MEPKTVDCDFDEQVVSPSTDNGWPDQDDVVERKSTETGNDALDDIAEDYY